MTNHREKIGLLDHMGHGNLGDAAILESFIANIGARLPDSQLIGFSLYPADTSKRHNLSCHPITWCYPGWNGSASESAPQAQQPPRLKGKLTAIVKRLPIVYAVAKPVHDWIQELRFLKRSYSIVRSLDLLVLAGGGQLCELYGSLPYNVFKFCLLARLSNVPVYMIGVGADLLKRPINKLLAKWSVRLCSYASVRSVESQALLRQLGVRQQTFVCPDPAYGLDLNAYVTSERSEALAPLDAQLLRNRSGCPVQVGASAPSIHSSATSPIVGLNPIGFCDPRRWPRKDSAAYSRFLDKLTALSAWLLARNYQLELFSSDISGDIFAIDDLAKRLSGMFPQSHVSVRPVLTLKELILQMSTYDFVVTPRFHGVVFSHMLAKPVIALSYLPKIDDLMRTVGHDRYCLDIGHFEAEALIAAFESLVAEQDNLRALFRETAGRYSAALRRQFDTLFSDDAAPARRLPKLAPAAPRGVWD